MTSRPQRTPKPINRFNEDKTLMWYEKDKRQRSNEEHESRNIKSNPTRNKTTIQTANKLWTKKQF